ncbi:PDZ domain-containing protein [Candidatus Woesearchaeota archaeon]|nr:PDZ domain-containing protein [Candidatus Woesearchaeota archaeon]MBW3005975.1 PDZ domain-containing protein [Candidatus Woesearchaeota archaeon]
MDTIYASWGISVVVTYLLLAILYGLFFKITSREFHKFTKQRLIADLILYSINLVVLAINIAYGLDISLFVGSWSRIAFFTIFTVVALFIDFFSVHLFVCSIVNVYKYFRKKRFKKNKRDIIVAFVYLILLNGFSKRVLILLVALAVLMIMSKTCPQEPCGIEVVQVMPGSPAELAGLTEGEVIVTAEYGVLIKSNQDFSNIISAKKPGDSLRFETETGKKYDINLGEQNGNVYLGAATRQKLCDKKGCTMTAEVIDYTNGEPVVVETRDYYFE